MTARFLDIDRLTGRGMMLPDASFSEIVAALEGHPDYRVLRRLKYRDNFIDAADQPTRTGIVLDVETTGLDTSSDEVVELGMVKFTYLPSGEIVRVVDTFSSLNEPTKPIPPEATKLHGITDEMVAGQKIDSEAVNRFASDAVVVIAHNAAFDRRFVERYWHTFVDKAWACSVNNIDWRQHGFEGSRLGYLLAGVGMFHQAHRAVDDCRALLEILAIGLPSIERTALSLLLENARKRTVRIWAEHSPFDLKDELKKRGYRWSSGDDGRPKAWYVDIDETLGADEIRFLCEHIYRRDVDLLTQVLTAFERYSVRA
ncbi:DNA polymerase-3 subunit epsilon [Nitrobacteraceae bacterium AZCC 1564]